MWGGGFSPAALLASVFSTPGALGDFVLASDLSRQFSDNGAVQANIGQGVGLGLGSRNAPIVLPTTGWVKHSGDGVVTVVGNLVTITGATTQTRAIPAATRTLRPGLTRIKATYTNTGSASNPLIYVAGVPAAPVSGVPITVAFQSTVSAFDGVQISSGSATFLIEEYTEIPGLAFGQSNGFLRPTLAREPKGGRRNLMAWTEDFSNAVWLTSNKADYVHGFADPFGTNRATRFKPVFATDPGSAARSASAYQAVPGSGAIQNTRYSVFFKPVNPLSFYQSPPDAAQAVRDVFMRIYNQNNGMITVNMRTLALSSAAQGIVNSGVIYEANGFYRVWYTAVGASAGNNNTWIEFSNRDSASNFNFDPYPDGTEEVHIFGAMLESGPSVNLSEPPGPYQRVNAATDVTEAGKEDSWFWLFDQADDVISAPINFGATPMTVFMVADRNANLVSFGDGPGSGSEVFGIVESGGVTPPHGGVDNPVYYSNGVLVSPNNRAGMFGAWPANKPRIIEARGLNLVTWAQLTVGFYTSFAGLQKVRGIVVIDEATANTGNNRALIMQALRMEAGLAA